MNAEDSDLAIAHTSSGAEALAKKVPKARVVSAFGTVPSEVFFGVFEARRKKVKPSLVYCGDDAKSRSRARVPLRAVREEGPLKNGSEGAGKAWQDVLAVEWFDLAEGRFGAVLPVDPRDPSFRVDDPNQPSPALEPVADLAERFAGAITGRQHLDHQIRPQRRKAVGVRVGHAFRSQERDIRTADGVRVGRDFESGIADEELPGARLLDVLGEEEGELGRDPAVLIAR